MTNLYRVFIALALLVGVNQPGFLCHGQSPFPASVRRVVFLGNSITYSGQYVTAIDAYLRTHYPTQPVECLNLGLPSETVSGLSEPGHADGLFPRPDLHERLARVLALTKPDLVVACYGMNDGIYLPVDEGRFRQFKDGITWLHQEVEKSGAGIIHLTPPVYDELKGGKVGYAAVLDGYSNWLMSQKTAQGWSVIDIHTPMKQFLAARRKVDAQFALTGFALADDGVHPGEVGHWLIAKTILLGLGEKAIATVPDLLSTLAPVANAAQILPFIRERQNLMKHAWLTATGHKRPGVKAGLPLEEAEAKAGELDAQIRLLMN